MSSDNIDILLNHSLQMDSLNAAHLQELSVTLEDKKLLREAIVSLQAQVQQLTQTIAEKDSLIAETNNTIVEKDNLIADKDEQINQLKARVATLEKRPTYNIAGSYIEHQQIDKMFFAVNRPKSRKKSIINQNIPQLPLWTQTELSI